MISKGRRTGRLRASNSRGASDTALVTTSMSTRIHAAGGPRPRRCGCSPRLAIVAGGGRQPADVERSLPSRTFGTLGMQVAYMPSSSNSVPVGSEHITAVRAFDIRGAEDGMQKITIHVGGVEQVDVIGDFSDWQPLTLTRRGRDTWELVVPVDAGVHKIDVRVDNGPWFAPPGLPTMRDGFGGVVGMLVVAK